MKKYDQDATPSLSLGKGTGDGESRWSEIFLTPLQGCCQERRWSFLPQGLRPGLCSFALAALTTRYQVKRLEKILFLRHSGFSPRPVLCTPEAHLQHPGEGIRRSRFLTIPHSPFTISSCFVLLLSQKKGGSDPIRADSPISHTARKSLEWLGLVCPDTLI